MPTIATAAPTTCLVLLLSVGACRLGGEETVPLRGLAPKSILVWPAVPAAFAQHAPALSIGLDLAVQRRGYDVTSTAVGRQMLVDQGLPVGADTDFARAGASLGVDAVLVLDVRDFAAEGDDRLQRATWDFEWQMLSTGGAGVVWQFAHRGSWNRRDLDTTDPLRRPDADPDIVPIGGDRQPSFRDVGDLAAWLHRFAMEHLPRRQR